MLGCSNLGRAGGPAPPECYTHHTSLCFSEPQPGFCQTLTRLCVDPPGEQSDIHAPSECLLIRSLRWAKGHCRAGLGSAARGSRQERRCWRWRDGWAILGRGAKSVLRATPFPIPPPACWGECAGEGRCEGGCCRPGSHQPSALSGQAGPQPPPPSSRAFQPWHGPELLSLGQPLTMHVSGVPSCLLGALSLGSARCRPFQVSPGGTGAGGVAGSKDRHCRPGYGLEVQGTQL